MAMAAKAEREPETGDGRVRAVIVGSVALDTVETPRARREEQLGGSLSYACAAASFFAPTGMVGVVGEDFPAQGLEVYRRLGIDVAGLRQVPGKTFRWSGVYEADMINRRTLATELNVFAGFRPALPQAYRSAPYLLLGNIAPALQRHVLEQAARPRFVVADTMDLWIETERPALEQVIGSVDMLMLNDSEARQLTGRYGIRGCIESIRAMGPRYVVVKRGEHGAWLGHPDGLLLVPAFPVEEVRDPTGAGDAFAGAFLGALAQADEAGDDHRVLGRSLLYGAVVASFGVEEFSLDRLAVLSRAEVDGRLLELQAMLCPTG